MEFIPDAETVDKSTETYVVVSMQADKQADSRDSNEGELHERLKNARTNENS